MYFAYFAQQAILLPYLPLYFQGKQFDSLQIGILITSGTFVAVFVQPVWGYISDRFQTIKKILAVLWTGTIIASVGLFNAEGFSATLIFAILLYLFLIPSVSLLDSIAVKTAESAGVSYGSIRLWGSLGFSVMALLSGLVFRRIALVENIQYVYWSLWIAPLLLLVFLKDRRTESSVRVTLKALQLIIKNRPLLWFLLMVFVIMIPHRMNDSLLGLYLQDLGATPQMVGLAWAIAAISEWGAISIYMFGAALAGISMLMLLFTHMRRKTV